jgi:hypothetical protein
MASTQTPARRRSILALAIGCAAFLGCMMCAGITFVVWPEGDDEPVPTSTSDPADPRTAMLGSYRGTYIATGSVAGFGQEYRDRGTIVVTEGEGSDLIFTGHTEQTGDTCRIVTAWDGSVARIRPGQSCEGEFNDGTTYTGTLDGIARVAGDALSIDLSGRVWGRRGFFPYAGNYTGEWRCTRIR